MPVTCVIGLQWGDEAKGKIVDLLTQDQEMVVRYQGGANAGHTVVVQGTKYKLSLVPSGILHPGVQCVVAGGVVIHPQRLLDEIETLRKQGVKIQENLFISDRAHIIFPWHLEEERLQEGQTNGQAIGTTMRGIGPCYRDKAGRREAVRLGDLGRDSLPEKIAHIAESKNAVLAAMAQGSEFQPLDAKAITEQYQRFGEALRPYMTDTTAMLLNAVEADKRILFEGAQGSLLDLDHGTFPYVTSSNSSGVGISSGSGVAGRYLSKIIGVVKAYNTRVGGGPFPTEEHGDIGQHIRDRGHEYGTVTGRPRRCGWFDAVAARYTARLGGVDCLSLMLLDVLDELSEIKICTAYEINGERTNDFPSHVEDLAKVKPVYETLPGWQQDTTALRALNDLPSQARAYIDRIGEVVGRPVEIVSVGPDRAQTVFASTATMA